VETGDPAADTRRPNPVERPIRTAEVVGALSIATDLGTGQPLEHALRTAVLAVRLGELAGASAEELADTYYVALLHASGCTSNGHEATQLYGDDIEHRAAFYLIDTTNREEVLGFYNAHVGAGRSPEVRAKLIEDAIANAGPRARDAFSMMCEVAQRFAGWLGLGTDVQAALEYVFARWDGRGVPDIAGDAIPFRCASCTWRGTSRCSFPPRAPRRHGRSSSVARVPRTTLDSPNSPHGTSTTSLPGSTTRGCGRRRWTASRLRCSVSTATGLTPHSPPSRRSPG